MNNKGFNLQPPENPFHHGDRGIFSTAWAIYWRIFLLPVWLFAPSLRNFFGFFVISLVIAGVFAASDIRLVRKPFTFLVKGRSPIYKHMGKAPTAPTRAPSNLPPYRQPQRDPNAPAILLPKLRQKQSTELGRVSGFEPRFLDQLPIPQSNRIYGDPGRGLNTSGFSQYSMGAGIKGEVGLAKTLAYFDGQTMDESNADHALLSKWNAFFSVHRPDIKDPHNFLSDADIDCVLYRGDTMVLIDSKMYRSGNLTYTHHPDPNIPSLLCIDNLTGALIGDPIKMSKNMSIAVETMRKLFPNMKIHAYVVAMPSDRGEATIHNSAVYPGGIRMVSPSQLHRQIESLAVYGDDDQNVIRHLLAMLKN